MEKPAWNAYRLKQMLLHYRIIEAVCYSGYDTCVAVGEENEDPLRFCGRLGTFRQRVPEGMRGKAAAARPAVFDLVDAKATVDLALKKLPHWAAYLLLAHFADGWTLPEIAGKLRGRWGWSLRTLYRRKAEAFDAVLGFLQ